MEIQRSTYKQSNPRILVNLLAKLTRTNPDGGHGGGLPSASSRAGSGEYTRERLVRPKADSPPGGLLARPLARLLAKTIGNIGNIS